MRRTWAIAALLTMILTANAVAAEGIKDFSHFQQIPVFDNGRLKPLDTYARNLLTRFSGHDHYQRLSAIAWLAGLLFNPTSTFDEKIFLINNPDIPEALGLNPQADRHYSPRQLQQGYGQLVKLSDAAQQIPDKQRSVVENEILRVSDNMEVYVELLKGQWMFNLLEVIPTSLSKEQIMPLMMSWGSIHRSYSRGDQAAFNQGTELYLRTIRPMLSEDELRKMDKFPLEILYQQSNVFTWSIVFYVLAFIFFVVSFASPKPLWYNVGLLSVMTGFIPHLTGLIMRIIIMGRPPVSSLYETFIFVSLITVILGLIIEYYDRQWLGIVTAAISGTALLFIANRYSTEGDTLKVLIAVLNSNFWLATHVTTITMGYGATCVGGVLGHIWLLQAVFKKKMQILDKTHKTTLGILGLALTLTFLGTNLGGIWADQSWGRFWGWDPKENGALMIVLWTALLFHAKVGEMIGPRGLAVGAVIGMMVVMWAWFGVNLLSVGLHSYGFTSGIATSLIIYAVAEVVFLVTVNALIWKNNSHVLSGH